MKMGIHSLPLLLHQWVVVVGVVEAAEALLPLYQIQISKLYLTKCELYVAYMRGHLVAEEVEGAEEEEVATLHLPLILLYSKLYYENST
jgi:hypothetical protein